ncbi:type II secretion system protein [Ruminococcus flavefaciens]|uniref:type II secretion system protein n=1 Tax=Ruminococcus flavefaciens TaxID=1265 RepID=UPI00048D5EED|nr:type II secretion system protein [Ruminococcus flavefaciens]
MKKRIKKGFTLVELIVVMAIFSILMVAVMALTGPVQRLFQKTALAEKTYSYANNIQLYLQGKLEYAEDVYVGTTDKLDFNGVNGVDDEDIAKLVETFRKEHFENTVTYDGNKANYMKGNIHVIKLCNSDTKLKSGEEVPRGQIIHRVYGFTSNIPISSTSAYTETADLNKAFFDAVDSVYNYNYALGSSNLKVVKMPPDSDLDDAAKAKIDRDVVYRALDKDIEDSPTGISATTLAVSIVLDKKDTGSIDIPAFGSQKACRAFASPVSVQIANLPLTNIAIRENHSSSPKGVKRPMMEAEGDPVKLQGDGAVGYAVSCDKYASSTFDFQNDIYFVYAYTDEMY